MGTTLFDHYSFLHFLSGILAHLVLRLTFFEHLLLHTLFEFAENTPAGIAFINTYLRPVWPGGKDVPDAMINRVGDVLSAMLGWLFAVYFLFPRR